MSLRNRARRLQHASGSTYQQALARLRALGASPAELARRNRWPLARCDRFLADRALDEEWRAVAARSRRVDEARCVCCGAIYFAGDDERRAQLDACPACRAPIEVLEVERVTRADVLGDACEELRVTANARAVLLVDRRGRELSHAGPMMTSGGLLLARSLLWSSHRPLLDAPDVERLIDLDTGDGTNLYLLPIEKRAIVMVLFDAATSYGLVRLRARRAAEVIARLLADGDAWGGPFGSGGGSGGAPAAAALEVAAVRRRFRS